MHGAIGVDVKSWLRERGVFVLVVLVLALALVLVGFVEGTSWVSLAKTLGLAVVVGRTASSAVDRYVAAPSSPTT